MPMCAFFPDFIKVHIFKSRLSFHSAIHRREWKKWRNYIPAGGEKCPRMYLTAGKGREATLVTWERGAQSRSKEDYSVATAIGRWAEYQAMEKEGNRGGRGVTLVMGRGMPSREKEKEKQERWGAFWSCQSGEELPTTPSFLTRRLN